MRKMIGWISVKKQLPQDSGIILIAFRESGKYIVDTGHYIQNHSAWVFNHWAWNDDDRITHWMPMPEPPEERENGEPEYIDGGEDHDNV